MVKQNLKINSLHSGGIITNYYCSSKCGHCLYACSPAWPKEYIKKESLLKTLDKIMELGCHSVHIGGGEPFLDFEGLKMVIETITSEGISVDMLETNSSWYRDEKSAVEKLVSLKKRGLDTLLVSISPFHNEYIPLYKMKGVIGACEKAGINAFKWTENMYTDIDRFDDHKTHSLQEYEKTFGSGYMKSIPSRYWIQFLGRALKTFASSFEMMTVGEIIEYSKDGCRELMDVSHFHIDLFNNYIPGLCSGIAIKRDDLGETLNENKYPIINILFLEGIKGLYKLVHKEYGFNDSRKKYISKCHLCYDIRKFLLLEKGIRDIELQPEGYYKYQ